MSRPASLKQKAYLAYLGHPTPDIIGSEEASAFIDAAHQDEAMQPLVSRWAIERIKLHPELYSSEAAALKASRFQRIFEFCENQREEYALLDSTYWPLKKLSLKSCRSAVEWLDANYVGWDSNLFDSADFDLNEKVIETYFVPAISNVAPDLIRKDRSGNPSPVVKKVSRNYKDAPRKKGKRGCLWWLLLAFLAWLVFVLLTAFFTLGSNNPSPPQPSEQKIL